ncbi:hypothetical protein R9X47_02350 [Wukongibacter baidiensis]|uniref:hypothetical protein n=1 Tax=Wukongibacter baidiensis TaxID=1723361 RepID=UPI003D7F4026
MLNAPNGTGELLPALPLADPASNKQQMIEASNPNLKGRDSGVEETSEITDEFIENVKKVTKFDSPDDPFRDVFGRGSESHPEEWNKLIQELEENGVEEVPRKGAMATGLLEKEYLDRF